ncbi:MAG: HAD family phosphatase [Pirellulales bacterium]|nr:HAD family phosphatase [Pirellulales bacterium]
MPPEFIYFDFGNVICFFDHHLAARQTAAVAEIAEDQAWNVIFGQPDGLEWKYESGQLGDEQFYEAFCQATGTRPNAEQFHCANADIFTLNTAIIPLIGHLEDSGIPLGILSNTCNSHWQLVTDGRYAILPGAFKKMVLSYHVGAIKPDPSMFRAAIEAAGVPAERIFYTDDIAGHVEAARRAGIDAVQFTGVESLAQELLKRGVRCNF